MRLSRPALLASLTGLAAVALIGCQQLLVSTATVTTPAVQQTDATLAFFVVAGEQERLRRCEAPDCRFAFVDLSRNRSRRYCDSRTCGNRLHVAAYRARRKEATG